VCVCVCVKCRTFLHVYIFLELNSVMQTVLVSEGFRVGCGYSVLDFVHRIVFRRNKNVSGSQFG